MSSISEPTAQQKEKSRVPPWIPIAAFVGTSFALGIPLIYLARQRTSVARTLLKKSSAAPPRRTGGSTTPLGRKSGASASETASASTSSTVEHSSPGTGELLSAISRVDFSTAIYAGKAFGIATGIVTVSAVALTLGVKNVMGVQDTQEFAQRMRLAVWRRLPSLTSKIHRPPDSDEDGGSVIDSEPDPTWNWPDAEKRLQVAYEQGGLPAWLQAAMKEMEAELNVERAKRQRESDEADRRAVVS
ncbi:hypothetical protein BDZ94DRAFT_1315165 [Collybia nuda]|uniref:Uncharacterized protein n=1 Tax=Collybia nuda TaxID=64659 RepID=A0A9P6CCX0_9AGAR|nr:hypothetical protein BDZ94DRAFT_1315165 [Collybia nuda]